MIKSAVETKNSAAQALGRKGGLSTFKKLGKRGMKALAKKGGQARWKNK